MFRNKSIKIAFCAILMTIGVVFIMPGVASAAAPTVTDVTPDAGPTAGGTSVTITGTGFTRWSSVSFGGTSATSVTYYSSTRLAATAPARSAGTVDIRVTTSGGTSATNANDRFTYMAAPTVTDVTPDAGPTAGGMSVVITGTNLTGATAVTFGGTAASSYTVNSATQITATAPARSAGTVDIRVTTAGGQSATNTGDRFTYMPAPTVTDVTPDAGPTAGGTSVVIIGTNLTGATAVSFGGTAASSFTVNSATQITATAPARSAGTVDITVTTASGTSTTSSSDRFAYIAAPTVTGVTPTVGPTAGGTSVVITGTNLSGATAVSFGGTAATSYTVNSATQITATSPARSAGTVDITVTTVGGTSATGASDRFTYMAAPTVTGVSPSGGPTAGGTSVVITGTNLTGATAVSFGGTEVTFTVNSATQITATAPAHAAGTVDITVTTAGGTSATSASDQFTYTLAPTVTSITPSSGPSSGGTSVTITGTNLTSTTAVSFGGTGAIAFTVDSATQITATAPAHSVGTVDITVTTVGGTSATSSSDRFTYLQAPTVTGITPSSGPASGGTVVTISGTDLTYVTVVTFGGVVATHFTVNSATQITATAPANAAGTVHITVTSDGGTSATSESDQFTYSGNPIVLGMSPAGGPIGGGTSVTLWGVNLDGVTAVSFGETPAASFTVDSPTQITATAPAHAAGAVFVTVTTAYGTNPAYACVCYVYLVF